MSKATLQHLFRTGIPYFLIVFAVTFLFANNHVQKGHLVFYAFVIFSMALTIERGIAGWLLITGVLGFFASGVVATSLPMIFAGIGLLGLVGLLTTGKLDFLQTQNFWTVLILNVVTFVALIVTETATMDMRKASKVDRVAEDRSRERNFQYLCPEWRDATSYQRLTHLRGISWCENYVGRLPPKIDREATASTKPSSSETLWK
ncbi:hypothetical protein ELG63_36380 [Rhizobium leguminosarum]|uniref:hypothetical protein n=1 Tax=Rhizobium leguminosarum TaxID=384 RepID=UPI0010320969|nr:hypothetical protein [Rhizobium leguminosarum]TBH28167.1 hypothetical protein ELG63_36380 [Rhizobium leguminosarum]